MIIMNEGGAGAADEPGGSEARGGDFLIDEREDLVGLTGGEGGVDPVIAEYDGIRTLPGFF